VVQLGGLRTNPPPRNLSGEVTSQSARAPPGVPAATAPSQGNPLFSAGFSASFGTGGLRPRRGYPVASNPRITFNDSPSSRPIATSLPSGPSHAEGAWS